MAAGATIGSNHNSRSADGELIAGRGFWPGLCVSVKHNSRFASFIILAKGDYPAELDIPLPFSLLSNDVSDDELLVMPAYWFLHNMYALARNAWKYVDRDKRIEKIQLLEYDYLAPDSIHEVADAMKILERFTALAWLLQSGESASSEGKPLSDSELILLGKDLLEKNDPSLAMLEITADNFENSSRKVRINKVPLAYPIYAEIILHYAICRVVEYIGDQQFGNLADLQMELPAPSEPESWVNVGGQLLKRSSLNSLISDIHRDKLHHALDILFSVHGISIKCANPVHFRQLLEKSISTAAWITNGILVSREKDYDNPFRRMVYDSQAEMDKVLGRPDENSFIKTQFEGFQAYRENVNFLINTWKL
jgi:hypothetical protein